MISVLMATYNGSYTLERTLNAFCEIKIANDDWELIIIDNGSEDSTKDIILSYQEKLPVLYLYEEKRGMNSAYNLGLKYVNGDLIIFTDDDVLPDPSWLINYQQAADKNPEYTVFGGTIIPFWEKEPLNWILQAIPLGPAYGIMIPLRKGGPASLTSFWGANFAFRRSIIDDGYEFLETVGPMEGLYMMGGETELLDRLQKKNHKGLFVENAIVKHIIRPWQLKKSWLKARAFRHGRFNFFQEFGDDKVVIARNLMGVPLWVINIQIKNYLSCFKNLLIFNKIEYTKSWWKIWIMKGKIHEYYVRK